MAQGAHLVGSLLAVAVAGHVAVAVAVAVAVSEAVAVAVVAADPAHLAGSLAALAGDDLLRRLLQGSELEVSQGQKYNTARHQLTYT